MRRLPIGLALVLATACAGQPAARGPRRATPTTTTATTIEFVGPGSVSDAFPAVTTLAHPRIADPDPARPRYVRDEWEPHGWADADRNGCNTRAEVLKAESAKPVTTKATNCTVVTGEWADRYTGRTVTVADQLQVDHLVALGDAAASGGWAWNADRKAAFANDLDDAWQLNAVWGAENERKADSGPDRWQPPRPGFRCTYVGAYAAIKARWGLTVTQAQWTAIETTWKVNGCG